MSTATGKPIDPTRWPLPADTFSHPRSAVTRFHAQYVRDRRLLTWPEAIAKTSYLPPLFLALQSPDI